jgi:hypothetical protein
VIQPASAGCAVSLRESNRPAGLYDFPVCVNGLLEAVRAELESLKRHTNNR